MEDKIEKKLLEEIERLVNDFQEKYNYETYEDNLETLRVGVSGLGKYYSDELKLREAKLQQHRETKKEIKEKVARLKEEIIVGCGEEMENIVIGSKRKMPSDICGKKDFLCFDCKKGLKLRNKINKIFGFEPEEKK